MIYQIDSSMYLPHIKQNDYGLWFIKFMVTDFTTQLPLFSKYFHKI